MNQLHRVVVTGFNDQSICIREVPVPAGLTDDEVAQHGHALSDEAEIQFANEWKLISVKLITQP